jgi:hypothetical protein
MRVFASICSAAGDYADASSNTSSNANTNANTGYGTS